MFNIIGHRKIWFIFSGILIIASIISLATWGLKLGVDFTGGSLLEIEFSSRPENNAIYGEYNRTIKEALASFNLGEINVQPSGEKGAILRFKEIDEETHQKVLATLKEKFGEINQKRFDSIGPTIGEELKQKAISAIIVSIFGIAIYIAWAFRKVSRPVNSWKYGVLTVATLFHDVIIPIGVFSILGHFKGIEIGTPFIAALLTILGYSINDTIIVFDRTRENLTRFMAKDFEAVVNRGVNETLVRSLNTSLTTLLALSAIFLFGGETVKYFALALIIGIAAGTYSSIFFASPLLVAWQKWEARKYNQ